MDYIPEYNDGVILVRFHPWFGDGFAKDFLKDLGYSVLKEEGYYYVQTPVGKEDLAIKKITEHKRYIDWSKRHDLKYQRRYDGLEHIVDLTAILRDDVDSMPDDIFSRRIDEVVNYLQGLKRERSKKEDETI